MKILEELKEKAKKINGTIILPEAHTDERVMEAGKIALRDNIAEIIVFGKLEDYPIDYNTPKCRIIDIATFEKKDEYINSLFELRKAKGMTIDEASTLINEPIYFTMMLLKDGQADGVVAGAKYSTADVLRPALQIIKTKPNKKIVTGNMLMLKEDSDPLVFGDVSLIEKPNVEQLAEIAIDNAEFMEKVVGVEPKVALLSYSTKGSAKSEMVDMVAEATKIAQSNSNYMIDGEMQVDSALDVNTAKKKGITSEVGGNANVLVFPDLNAGNIGYKLVARLGGYTAVGPIMLNFNKPVNDLSRGCTVDEIVNTISITKLMI